MCTFWQVWTYAITSDTITRIKGIDISNASQSFPCIFLVFFLSCFVFCFFTMVTFKRVKYRYVFSVIKFFFVNKFEIWVIYIFILTRKFYSTLKIRMRHKCNLLNCVIILFSFKKFSKYIFSQLTYSSLLMKLNIVFIFINHLHFTRFCLAPAITSRRLRMGGGRREMENKVRFWNVIRGIEWREQEEGQQL